MDPSRRVSTGWAVALGGTAAIAALAAAPGVADDAVADAVHAGFSAVCHQIPERSPTLAHGPLALCHRCSGILAGLVLGLAAMPLLPSATRDAVTRSRQGLWLVASAAPTALDWALGATGVWANVPASRVATGAVFGLAAGVILGANLLVVRRPSSSSPQLAS